MKNKYIFWLLKGADIVKSLKEIFTNDDVSLTFGVFLTQILSGPEKNR